MKNAQRPSSLQSRWVEFLQEITHPSLHSKNPHIQKELRSSKGTCCTLWLKWWGSKCKSILVFAFKFRCFPPHSSNNELIWTNRSSKFHSVHKARSFIPSSVQHLLTPLRTNHEHEHCVRFGAGVGLHTKEEVTQCRRTKLHHTPPHPPT